MTRYHRIRKFFIASLLLVTVIGSVQAATEPSVPKVTVSPASTVPQDTKMTITVKARPADPKETRRRTLASAGQKRRAGKAANPAIRARRRLVCGGVSRTGGKGQTHSFSVVGGSARTATDEWIFRRFALRNQS